MTYPASPSEPEANRLRPDPGQFWAGAAATAVVAALIALVGILICRWTLHIPILAPAGEGAWGNAHTAEYALVAALIALIAAGLLYLLMLGTPQPQLFFSWIIGLATLAAVVYPFSTSAPLDQKAATAVVNLVLGIAIASLLSALAARAVRRPAPPRPADDRYDPYDRTGYDRDGYDRQRVPGPRYRPQPGERYPGQEYPGQEYPPREYPQDAAPTRPIDTPQRRGPRR